LKSGTSSCSSLGRVWSVGLRETDSTFSTESLSRHSSRTPSPTMPVTPVMMMRMSELYTARTEGRSAGRPERSTVAVDHGSGNGKDDDAHPPLRDLSPLEEASAFEDRRHRLLDPRG